MEEGFMLVFPERVLKGDIPNRDFLHLYGPGSLWALAGVFKVFGVSLLTERVFALMQELAIVVRRLPARAPLEPHARDGRARSAPRSSSSRSVSPRSRGSARSGSDSSVSPRASRRGRVPTSGLPAASRSRPASCSGWQCCSGSTSSSRSVSRSSRSSGASSACAASDCSSASASRLRRISIHVATAGSGNVVRGMVLDPVFNLRGGRSLPIPPSWSHFDGFLQKAGALQQLSWPIPDATGPQQLFIWFFLLIAVVLFLLVQAWRLMRTDSTSLRARTLLVVAIFSAGILPQAIQRVDSAHFAWVGCVPFGFLPVALFELARRRLPRVTESRLVVGASATALAVIVLLIPAFTVTRYTDYSLQTFGAHRHSYRIEHDGRIFYYGKKDRADAANLVIAEAARISRPGQRLFVGPVDLRKTPYSDAYLYYMLPELKPATYYIEMDPGVANADDSGLDRGPGRVRHRDPRRIWDNWEEPNDSRKVGSDKAAEGAGRPLLPRRHVSRPVRAVPTVPLSAQAGACSVSLLCGRSS